MCHSWHSKMFFKMNLIRACLGFSLQRWKMIENTFHQTRISNNVSMTVTCVFIQWASPRAGIVCTLVFNLSLCLCVYVSVRLPKNVSLCKKDGTEMEQAVCLFVVFARPCGELARSGDVMPWPARCGTWPPLRCVSSTL